MQKENKLDIVQLIERNPITRLNKQYEHKFIQKIKNNFTESQQQMFAASFYTFLNHNSKTDFIIDMELIWKWLGFDRKGKCKELLVKYFTIDIDYKINLNVDENLASPVGEASFSIGKHGGSNKETILLNTHTFKRLCLKSNAKKADEVHEYFIKLEEIFHEILNEESDELRKQLQIEQNNKPLDRHNLLLREFNDIGCIVYIIKVKTCENGSYIIRLGESRRGVKDRCNEHKQNYGEALILDCFMVKKSRDFEAFLHNHNDIKINRVIDLIGHKNEKELFLIGKKLSYQHLLNIIKQNIKYYNDDYQDLEKIRLENKQLEIMQNFDKNDMKDFIQISLDNYAKLNTKIDNLESIINTLNHKIETSNSKTRSNFNQPLCTLGPRVQQINSETLQLVKVYESASQCIKENINIKRPSLNKAIIKNTIYQNYRWLFVDREFDASKVSENICQTKVTRVQNIGYIAKLNINKTQILNIYLDRKTGAKLNNIKSLDNIVKTCKLIDGCYYILYNELSEELRNKYEKPILYKYGIGKFDVNNNLLKEFICKEDTRVKENISNKSLTKALDSGNLYNNFYYKFIGEKLKSE